MTMLAISTVTWISYTVYFLLLLPYSSVASTTAYSSSITTVITTNTPAAMSTSKKTIYLIRHAESEENRRLGSLKSAFSGLTRCQLPNRKDVYASFELLNVSAQIDSDVSPKGKEQVCI